jgi:hypothetical protein
LEHFQKSYSRAVGAIEPAVFLVLASFRLGPMIGSIRQKQKSPLRTSPDFSSNALTCGQFMPHDKSNALGLE